MAELKADDISSDIASAWAELKGADAKPAVAEAPVEAAPDPTAPPPAEPRPRDEQGRFAPKAAAEPAAPAPQTPAANPQPQAQASPQSPAPTQGQTVAPPPGWSPAAKVEFEKLPQAVKEAVAKREEEINAGFAKLMDYKGLDQFVDMAKQHNTTLPEVLQRYQAAEHRLQTNPEEGILWLMQNYRVNPVEYAQKILRHFGGQQQQGQPQPGYQPPAPYDPLMQQVSTLTQYIQNMEARQQEERINTLIGDFASKPEHRFWQNVEEEMAVLIETGRAKNLDEAYQQAIWLNPETRAILIKEQQAAAAPAPAPALPPKGRSPAPGSPLPGVAAEGKRKVHDDPADDIRAAWRDMRGGV